MENQRVALITGVSRQMGLGFETARQLGQLGYMVCIGARDGEQAKQLAAELSDQNLQVTGISLDILSDDSVQKSLSYIKERYGRLNVLINNAGGFYDADIMALEQNFDFTRDAFETNLFGTWRMMKAFVPLLEISEQPAIVNVSSGAGAFSDVNFGLLAKPDTPAYGLSKLALNGLTAKVAAELRSKKIKVNAVCPGFTATYPGTAEWGARPVEEGAKSVVWAATLPPDGPSGGFFRDGKKLPW